VKKLQLWCLIILVDVLVVVSYTRLTAHPVYARKGLASWYGKKFDGRQTASGERFSQQEMTAAHRTLPLGTKVIVENLKTGKQAEVKITDRGPYADPQRRIIDLSRAAADSIGIDGVGPVRVVVTEPAPVSQEADYEIQVGAFTTYTTAQQVLTQVQDRVSAAYIAPRDGPLGRYYRVRVGPFATERQAEQVATTLKRRGYRIFLDAIPDTATLG
jgi:rare lipoprotein A